jgi:hypothetical protein
MSDFVWVADNWDAMYEELVKFKLEHGNTEVPGNKVAWTIGAGQRSRMRQNKLPLNGETMEEIGFNIELKVRKDERNGT